MDFIIEGDSNKIAIECDGNKCINTESWEISRERQKVLERVGWTFYRIRGSEFYRDPESTMKDLWIKLKNMGIENITA